MAAAREPVEALARSGEAKDDRNPAASPTETPARERLHVRKDKTNPRRITHLTLLLFASPPGWPLLALGALLVTAAVLLHGWAAGYLARAGYAEREKILTVRGPYRHTRNPYYLAQMTMDLGFFFLAGWPLFYLLYFPVIFSVYRRWVANEERFLENEFGEDYRALKQQVPRWAFRLTPAPSRGSEVTFRWGTFMLNREWPRSLSHLLLMSGFIYYFLFGNPFAQIDGLTRATVIAAIAVWLMLRDIYPVDVSQKSLGWALAALSSAVMTTVFLVKAPVWELWSQAGSWISIAAGLCLGLMVSATALPAALRGTGKNNSYVFARPMSQLYALGLALGLLSCTLGGVWAGIMVPFVFWALGIAGLVPVKMLPRHLIVALGLFLLFLFSGGVAIALRITDWMS
jgi:hypothetical protein